MAKYKYEWENKSREKIPIDGLPELFIYVPLHLQPEATTSSIGGVYYNQMFMIYLKKIKKMPIFFCFGENSKVLKPYSTSLWIGITEKIIAYNGCFWRRTNRQSSRRDSGNYNFFGS